ncbi:LytTR family transcriptional regulator [Agaricicola taiwanensis]|uniref:LytTR family transcriptional regulator n=1 Tax=Agaricicola taiwanensis TaxID=591372 RepID=A0A8J2YGL5_9RHOB|nr:DUF4159 domain-containing protein [Agaricicola taiwanensis]GGE39964.1 LytTR family transcriptional regulator [Agaricicola taiwanensis]
MFGLPLAFASPWLLVAFAALPALWWLLRVVPPQPQRVPFPPLRLLMDAVRPRETPANTPWWLILLRLLLAALVILALAGPIWRPQASVASSAGPLILLIDDGWPAAPDWPQRRAVIEQRLTSANDDGRPVAMVPLAQAPGDITLGTGAEAIDRLRVLTPRPHLPQRAAHQPSLERILATAPNASIVWYADGLDQDGGRAFAEALARLASGRVTVHVADQLARGLIDPRNRASALTATVLRANAASDAAGTVRALDQRGRPVGEADFTFGGNDLAAEVTLELPLELRNAVSQLEIVGERSAGAVSLMDSSSRRRTVGLLSGTNADTAQPLLAPGFYIGRALEPFADVSTPQGGTADAIGRMIDDRVSVMVLADIGTIPDPVRPRLDRWISEGGVLIRFSGGRLAAGDDDLVPVRLRRGDRTLGGALSWEVPQALGSFSADGPFAGLPVPEDVEVNRQILAEPDAELPARTWAALTDGTPLVTGRQEGKGLIALFHVTGDTTWSNLPLSGAFVSMLERLVELSPTPSADLPGDGAASEQRNATPAEVLSPLRTLDGFGVLGSPPPTARPLTATISRVATPDHPPGFYGAAESPSAVNALASDARLVPLNLDGVAVTRASYAPAAEIRLAPAFLAGATGLLMLDALIVLLFAGALTLRRAGTAAVVTLCLIAAGNDARAQAEANDAAIMESALTTRLAYVVTGDAEIDETSRSGLEGLALQLATRTAFEPGETIGIDPETDDLSFYPLLYWPVVPEAQAPTPEALSKIDSYMKLGGTIIFDTRDALYSTGSIANGPGGQALRRILASLDVPDLEPVPLDHVLTKAFYLMPSFPGRYAEGELWVEALPAGGDGAADRPARSGDGVSPIMITSNDLAGAWAIQPDGSPRYPTTPGDPRQRELAYRAGINIVMYALTGNYKADQVHIPALLERLGQ